MGSTQEMSIGTGFPGIPEQNSITKVLNNARNTFSTGITLNFEFRKEQLRNLRRMFIECESQILSALHQDLRKPAMDGKMGDIKTVLAEIKGMLRHFKEYTSDEKLPFNVLTALDKSYIRKEPFGVVLILGTWNFPFMSCCQPLVGAIAAGNCVIVKPSEVAPTCADTIAKLLPRYLDKHCYHVVTGDVEMTRNLLKNKFDYIFCTGSPAVGQSILQAAAPHLTPVTLELGGKNPCYIDSSVDLRRAVKRTLWGKSMNHGQICVGPDYIICLEEVKAELIQIAKEVLQKWFGKNGQDPPETVRIVNKRHFNRLKNLLETTEGKIAVGGQMDESDLWMEPTIVVNVDPEKDSLMQEEIFGPILPVVSVSSVNDAIRIIRSKPKPLAVYIFSNDRSVTRKLIQSTSSGSICVNDVFWQSNWIGLPFGGVGESGMGSYHGKSTFDTFSHRRAVVERPLDYVCETLNSFRYPPYTNFKFEFMSWIINNFENCIISVGGAFSHSVAAIFGAAVILFVLSVFRYDT